MTPSASHDSFRSISGYPKATGGRFPAPLPFAAAIPSSYPNTLCSGLFGGPQLGGLTCGSFCCRSRSSRR
jgi:hypothetical protein